MAMSCWSVCVREEPELLVTVVELVEWWSREMKVRWEWWDWEETRNIQWCRKDSLDLIGHLGSSGACTVSILLVGLHSWERKEGRDRKREGMREERGRRGKGRGGEEMRR